MIKPDFVKNRSEKSANGDRGFVRNVRTFSHILSQNFAPSRLRQGFTLVEILIFAAIFSVVMVTFLGILVFVLQIQTREHAEATVNQESQFLLSTIERYVESASLVDIPQDVGTSTLRLRMSASSSDPTTMYLSGTTVYLQTAGGAPQALTSPNVNVTALSFARHANAPGHDSVATSFTLAYYVNVMPQNIARSLEIGVARVSAATFDSSVIPSSASLDLGVTNQTWRSVNNTLYFGASNAYFTGVTAVGIGTANPTQLLQVGGGGVTGDIYVGNAGSGIILKNTNNVCVRLYYGTAGQLATSSAPSCL